VTAHVASLIVDRKQQQHARSRLLSERLLPARYWWTRTGSSR